MLASLGQIIVPLLGVLALTKAMMLSGILGKIWTNIATDLPAMGFTLFFAIWLAGRIFPHGAADDATLKLSAERRAEGRFLALF